MHTKRSTFLLFFLFGLLLCACDQPTARVENETVEVQLDGEEAPVVTSNKVNSPEQVLVPTETDISRYSSLQETANKENKSILAFLAESQQTQYPELSESGDAEYWSTQYRLLTTEDAAGFAKTKSLGRVGFDQALHELGLLVGYTALNNADRSKGLAALPAVKQTVRELKTQDILQEDTALQYKIYEWELVNQMEPTPGAKAIKITVDKEGTIFFDDQPIGKAVATDGVFAMEIKPELLME